MLEKSLNSENEEEYDNNDFRYEIIILSIFCFLLISNWLSLECLYEYQSLFTIHRYINNWFSIYFPIQISSIFLFILDFLSIIIITVSCNFFILNTIIILVKKEGRTAIHKLPRMIFIPILLNSFLFLFGKIVFRKNSIFFYFLGLLLDLISLFPLLKINIDKNLKNNYFSINYPNDIIKEIFEGYFFEILLALDFYYSFYALTQIIDFFTYNLYIDNYLGIITNLLFGIVSLYIIFELKNNAFTLFMGLIFGGIFHFQFTIRPQEREEINLGNGELILSCFFLICFFIESIYIIIYKCQNKN
jgi:hypothetical protein